MNKILRALFLFAFIAGIAVFSSSDVLRCSAQSSPADYFKGNWTVTITAGLKGTFSWTLKEDLDGSWLTGEVEQTGKWISKDFWRESGGKLERIAFSANGLFVKMSSNGWEKDKLVFSGTANNASGEFNVRETITKISEKKFNALWEMQDKEGKWTVFSNEECSRTAR